MYRIGVKSGFLLLGLSLAGCDECFDDHCCHDGWSVDHEAPLAPVGLVSVTGDGEVFLSWFENQEDDLDGYRIFVSDRPDGPYDSIGETRLTSFTDHGARNGRTYFYAVTALDLCDNESDLSYETVHDTPRPEGKGLTLFSADGSRFRQSGFDFSAFHVQGPDDPGTDIYFRGGTEACLLAASTRVGIQDVGFLPMEGLDWAPDAGWSPAGRVEAIAGHTYAVLTQDGYYAKFHVEALSQDSIRLSWAVQLDRGNRELSLPPPVESPSPPPGGSKAVAPAAGEAGA